MHLSLQTLTLLGTLTLTLAEKNAGLGYLKCASAVVRTTSFPSCASSQKLDCFCEAQAKESRSPTTTRVQLSQDVEDLCAENGVPKEDIARYLCDDKAVPASPRRGSSPMVRLEQEGQPTPSPQPFQARDQDGDKKAESVLTLKRAIRPDSAEPPSSENKQGAASEPDADRADTNSNKVEEGEVDEEPITSEDTYFDEDEDEDEYEDEEDIAAAGTSPKVAIVTETKTECYCEKTGEATATSASEPAESPASDAVETHKVTSGALHGTEVASSSVAALASATSFTQATSSSIVQDSPVPTGVDGQREHGAKKGEGEGEDRGEDRGEDKGDDKGEDKSEDNGKSQDGKVFEGGAVIYGVSSGLVMGVLGVVAGVVLL